MDFLINDNEFAALYGLPHLQQLTYLRGIRPYMDFKTGIVGIKRRISYQSLAEQVYIEPHQGVKCQTFSRDQMRRSVMGLVRAGVISVQSEGMQLILKCELASRDFSVQNKATINPPQKATTNPHEKSLIDTGFSGNEPLKADIARSVKPAIPLKDNNYLYIFFAKFWEIYPQKNSKLATWEMFQNLNPDQNLCQKIINALTAQITHRSFLQAQGLWVPPWKYPATWLAKQCWEDEVSMDMSQENTHATHRQPTRKDQGKSDLFCPPSETEEPTRASNVVQFKQAPNH